MTTFTDRPVGVTERVAGLCSGGLVAIGFALLLLQLLAPQLAPGTGLGAATGPGWASVVAHLGVGVLGEVLIWQRRRIPRAARVWLALAMIVLTIVVLWLYWWR